MKCAVIITVAAALVSAAGAQAPAFNMVAVSWNGNASGIDSFTGGGVLLGQTGFNQLNSMARDPVSGFIYTIGSGGTVLAVNPATGAAVTTGVAVGVTSVTGLAFDPFGVCWAVVGGSPDALYMLDLNTGATTLVGPTGFGSLQSLAADPVSGTLWSWDVNGGSVPPQLVVLSTSTGAGTGMVASGVQPGEIQALTFSSSGVLYGCRNALYTIDTATGVATLVGSGSYNDVRGFDFVFGPPPQPPTYPGNGSDVATKAYVNGVPQAVTTGVHIVNGGDAVALEFLSPGGSLTFFPFLAFFQVFPTGSPPPAEPAFGLFIDPALAGGVIADGLSNPAALFNPVLGAWVAAGSVPAGLAGSNVSILLNCIAFDPSFPPFNVGIANAREFVVN